MNANWTDGYVNDIGYTHGYYPPLNPARMQLALSSAGLDSPVVSTACELGFGQGLSINIHAAASPVKWFGNDFNAAQAAHAQQLARAAASGASLHEASFADFCTREDLPPFDFIAMHGVWSWVSADNRARIRDFVARRLKPGGVLYVSYNTQPGWAAFMPLRDLLLRHFELPSNAGKSSAERIDAALDFADRLFAADPVYARANPFMQERLAIIRKQSRHYLAHEYFNRHWHVEGFADMAGAWMDAGLEFACSADLRDHLDLANLSQAQHDFCATVADRNARQAVRDFMVNQQFRRDYWVRGARLLDSAQHQAVLARQQVVLLTTPSAIPMSMKTVSTEIVLNRLIYDPIIAVLSDLQPHSLGDIAGIVGSRNVGLQQVLDAIRMLVGGGHAAAVPATSAGDGDEHDALHAEAIHADSVALNRHVLSRAAQVHADGDIEHLASPITGGGVPVNRIEQLFMLAVLEQQQTPEEIVDFVWRHICALDKKLVVGGETISDEGIGREQLRQQAIRFFVERLPLLQALQVI